MFQCHPSDARENVTGGKARRYYVGVGMVCLVLNLTGQKDKTFAELVRILDSFWGKLSSARKVKVFLLDVTEKVL